VRARVCVCVCVRTVACVRVWEGRGEEVIGHYTCAQSVGTSATDFLREARKRLESRFGGRNGGHDRRGGGQGEEGGAGSEYVYGVEDNHV